MGRGRKICSHLLSALEAPPLGCGDLEIVLVSICMCQCDSQCVFHAAAALEVPVHLNPVGGGGGGDRKTQVGWGGRRWGSPWFPLLPSEEQLRFPAGDGWPGLGGMLWPIAPSRSLCGDRCSCRGPVPCTIPAPLASSPASSHQVVTPAAQRALGWQGGLVPLETCQWWGV